MKTERAPRVSFFSFLALSVLALVAASPSAARAQQNLPPVIAPLSDLSVNVGQLVLFAVHGTDPEGTIVDLTISGLPGGARFLVDGNGNGSFMWTPAQDQGGSHIVTFIATDRGTPMMSAMAEVTITVNGGDRPPVLDPIGDQEAVAGVTVSIPLSATDPDGDPLVFTVDPVPSGSFIVPGAPGAATWQWLPGPDQVGNHELTFTVSDGLLTDEETIVVTVGNVNAPPALTPIGDRAVDAGDTLEIALLATDANGDALSFDVAGLPADAMVQDLGDGTALIRWTPGAAEIGPHDVTVTVTDDGTPPESASETFTIDVRTPPLVLDDALWVPGSPGHLRVAGHGAAPGAAVEIRDAVTGSVLHDLVAGADGGFGAEFQTLVPPCSVDAESQGASTPGMDVGDAPSACSGDPSLRVWRSLWICRSGWLQVLGNGAPVGATLRLYDAASGELLAVAPARYAGFFRLQTRLDAAPAAVRIGVVLDGMESMLGPYDVQQLGRCQAPAPRGHGEHHGHGDHHGDGGECHGGGHQH